MENSEKKSGFIAIPNSLLEAKSFISPVTQERIALSLTDKVIYCKMKSRYKYFQEYRDTYRGLAKLLDLHYLTVFKCINKLKYHNIVLTKKQNLGYKTQQIYLKINPLKLSLEKGVQHKHEKSST